MEIEQIPSDVEEIEVPLPKRKIYTDQADPQIDSLYNRRKRGKLVLQPDFQRRFVWDSQKSSRLMESALLGLPLPMIYLSEERDGKEYVIDGQQRLTSFFSFIDGKFPNGKSFKLTGLEVFKEYNGKSFSDLDEELQEKIMYCKIRTVIFSKDTDEDLKFEIYKKLNTGVVVLNDQELRNCIYNGEYSELLKQLSEDKDFMYLLGLKERHPRMIDVELVLRFAAFYHTTYLKYKSPMKKFFNDDMRKFQHISEVDRAELIIGFKNAVAIIKSTFGDHAFRRFYEGNDRNKNGNWEPSAFNHALYDILMYSFAKEDKSKVYKNLDAIRETLIYLMTSDKEFINTIEHSTSTVQSVTKRFDKWRLALQEIIGAKKEPRCFSFKLKQELYNNDPTCSICGQKIQNIDDAAIDHIEQYWIGGKTIPENARLTHRYCNLARSRRSQIDINTHQEEGKNFNNKAFVQTKIIIQDIDRNIQSIGDKKETIQIPILPSKNYIDKENNREKNPILEVDQIQIPEPPSYMDAVESQLLRLGYLMSHGYDITDAVKIVAKSCNVEWSTIYAKIGKDGLDKAGFNLTAADFRGQFTPDWLRDKLTTYKPTHGDEIGDYINKNFQMKIYQSIKPVGSL